MRLSLPSGIGPDDAFELQGPWFLILSTKCQLSLQAKKLGGNDLLISFSAPSAPHRFLRSLGFNREGE
jgi:hypothetical protein